MSIDFYDAGLEGILNRSIDLNSGDLRLLLVNAGYTRNLATHKFRSAIGGPNTIISSNLLTGFVASGRNFTFDVTVMPAAPAGVDGTQIVLAEDTGSPTTDRLVCVWDSSSGLPITPNGSDINIIIGLIGVDRA